MVRGDKMQTSRNFYSTNLTHRRGNHRARDTTKDKRGWFQVNVRTQIKLIPEYHKDSGHHCHLKTPEGRADLLILCDRAAPNLASRFIYVFHHPKKRPEGVAPLVHFDPASISRRKRYEICKKVERVLGSRPPETLRTVPSDGIPYSLLNATPYR